MMKMAQKVVDYKLLDGKRYYKVKWECSWESEDNLQHCHNLVEQFWNFINRVKLEDTHTNEPTPVRKKVRIEDKPRNSFSRNANEYSEPTKNSYTNIVPCTDARPDLQQQQQQQQRKSSDSTPRYSHGNGEPVAKKSTTLRGNGERYMPPYTNMQGNDDSGNENGNGIMRKTRKITHLPEKNVTIVDNTSSNHKMITNMDIQQVRQQHESAEKSKSSANAAPDPEKGAIESWENIAVPSGPELVPSQNANDSALHWTNPYVQISFLCRVCHEEQPFCNNNRQWEKHFLTHVEGSLPDTNEEDTNSFVAEEASSEDTAIIEDPDRPWIQRVEYIIQKWGVSQYVRLAFSCRICHKEQQASHTGNWRNHYNSHHDNRPHACKKCNKIFKSKSTLTQHLKEIHNESDGRNVSHTCFVCGADFNRKLDMRRHIAVVHNIDPNSAKSISAGNVSSGSPAEIDNRTILSIVHKTAPSQKTKPVMPVLTKENTSFTPILKAKDSPMVSTSNTSNSNDFPPTQTKIIELPSKNCNSPSNDMTKSVIYKHTCGICQQRFRKKQDLKSHTINVHCININQPAVASVQRVDSSELLPSMVTSGEMESLRSKTSVSEYHSSDTDTEVRVLTDADVRTMTESESTVIVDSESTILLNPTYEKARDNVGVVFLMKEERLSSDEDGRGDHILTIDENDCSPEQ